MRWNYGHRHLLSGISRSWLSGTLPSHSRPVDVMTVPGVKDFVMGVLTDNDIHCHTYINDVER